MATRSESVTRVNTGRLEGVGGILERAVASLPQRSRIWQQMALCYWDEVLGPQASAAAQPERVHDGVVYVRTRSSVWSQEIMLLRGKIIAELNKRLGRKVLKDLRCHVQTSPTHGVWTWVPYIPAREEISAVELDPAQAETLNQALAELEAVADPAMRERIRQTLEYQTKLRVWRLRQGWRECAQCGGAFRSEEGNLCGFCAALGPAEGQRQPPGP